MTALDSVETVVGLKVTVTPGGSWETTDRLTVCGPPATTFTVALPTVEPPCGTSMAKRQMRLHGSSGASEIEKSGAGCTVTCRMAPAEAPLASRATKVTCTVSGEVPGLVKVWLAFIPRTVAPSLKYQMPV